MSVRAAEKGGGRDEFSMLKVGVGGMGANSKNTVFFCGVLGEGAGGFAGRAGRFCEAGWAGVRVGRFRFTFYSKM